MAVAPAVYAQSDTPSPEAEQTRHALEQRKNDLNSSEDKARSLQDDVSSLDAERERLNARLVETAALIQRSEAQLTAIEGRLAELEAQQRVVSGSLENRQSQIGVLLGALQRMGRNPPPVLISRREDALKTVRSAMLLSSVFPELSGQAASLSSKLDDLGRTTSAIRTEGQRLQTETDRLSESKSRLSSLLEAKKLTIADRQSELVAVRAASAEISRGVNDLSELISKLDRTVSEKTGLGAYQAELQQRPVTTPVTLPAPVSVAAVAPAQTSVAPEGASLASPPGQTQAKETVVAAIAPPALKPAVELAPQGSAITANPGRIKPSLAFSAALRRLPLPAQGRRVLNFGEKTQYGAQSKGIVLETRAGAQVTSPCDGWVVYAGEFRSYGQLLIINAGDGYHILLAGLSQIDAQPGQFVLAAEPVGTMSGGQKQSPGQAQLNAPVLYIEFRKDGRPVDPNPWWVAGQQKVQG